MASDAPLSSGAKPAWAEPSWLLGAAVRIVGVTVPDLMPALEREVTGVLGAPPAVLALLTGDCPRSPLKARGADAEGVTSAELAAVAQRLEFGERWEGMARLGRAERLVMAVRVAPGSPAGSVFALALDSEPDAATGEVLAGLLELTAVAYATAARDASIDGIAANLLIAQDRARTVAELSEQQAVALSTILAALRARDRSDAAARAAATDAAVEALLDLRRTADRERDLVEEELAAAFERLREQLAPLVRERAAELELVVPEGGRMLASELAHVARSVVHGALVALLDAGEPERLRVGWTATATELTVEVRDDGDGLADAQAIAGGRLASRVAAVGGTLAVDAVPGWGTTIRAMLPLAPAPASATELGPLDALNARERDVLAELVRGSRNRQIADALTISENTVKFHVANILRKLEVATRGEAAAVARDHGLDDAPPLRVVGR